MSSGPEDRQCVPRHMGEHCLLRTEESKCSHVRDAVHRCDRVRGLWLQTWPHPFLSAATSSRIQT